YLELIERQILITAYRLFHCSSSKMFNHPKLPNCQTAKLLFNRSSLSPCFIPTSSNKKADALASARIVLCD
ncbi:hypothetical protein, partial [Vibrio cholerae]|uniref:hypothetical protein n=1 Tax=Vibrio cholerae TaxID=666 RepID=UPI002D771F5E